jgi:outer membrane protein OmpA-like peptidoglycan-associated protein
VRFGTAKADLPPGDIPSLDQIATVLVEYPELKVRIEGHTDNSGRDETNLALSQKRAEAVMEALVQRGVAGERLTALGIGEARPIASNESQAGRSQNRRVEIYVLEP